jgi:hypothetical protein
MKSVAFINLLALPGVCQPCGWLTFQNNPSALIHHRKTARSQNLSAFQPFRPQVKTSSTTCTTVDAVRIQVETSYTCLSRKSSRLRKSTWRSQVRSAFHVKSQGVFSGVHVLCIILGSLSELAVVHTPFVWHDRIRSTHSPFYSPTPCIRRNPFPKGIRLSGSPQQRSGSAWRFSFELVPQFCSESCAVGKRMSAPTDERSLGQ